MTEATAKRLERIKYRSTLYEIALRPEDGSGPGYLLGYSKKTKRHVLDWMRKHSTPLVAVTGDYFANHLGKHRFRTGDWIAEPTGRTQREAIIEGELPWIGDVKVKGGEK